MISQQQFPAVLPNLKTSQDFTQFQAEEIHYDDGVQLQDPLVVQKLIIIFLSIFSGIVIGLLTPGMAQGLVFMSERLSRMAEIFILVMLYG